MQLLAVGDLHGKDCWKSIDPHQYDQVVFIGDYVDSVDIPPDVIRENLRELIDFKKRFPDKVILLLGNHDIQYSEYPKYHCSGFNPEFQVDYTELFRSNKDLFQVAFQRKNYLFTHAGISNAFARVAWKDKYDEIISGEMNVADFLNDIDRSDNQEVLHTVGIMRGGGDYFGGITWADRRETCFDFLYGYHQIVGHTQVSDILTERNSNSSITYIDVLNTKTLFFELSIE